MTLWKTTGTLPLEADVPRGQIFVLVDGAQSRPVGPAIHGHPHVLAAVSLFDGTLEGGVFDVAPWLLQVDDVRGCRSVVRALQGGLESHGALSILVSPLPHAALAERLRARLAARLPDDFDCINRYFDARVLPHLHACLASAQREAFFCIARQWWVLDHAQQWRPLACDFSPEDGFTPPLSLDDAQQAYMIDACYPYAVIEHFRQTDEELLDRVADNRRYAFFRDTLAAARGYGIDGGPFAVLFCTLALTRGEEFFREPGWSEALERVRRGDAGLAEVVKARHA